MTEVSAAPSTAPVPAGGRSVVPTRGEDWTVQAADTIESVVETIREKAVVPLTTVARGIVYGIVAGLLGAVALVLLVVAGFRVAIVYLPGLVGDTPGRSVWVTDAIVGGIFSLAGLFLLRKANAKPKTKER